MGRQGKIKAARRDERRVKAALEASGVGERVRSAYLGLRREDVQADIRGVFESAAPWGDKPALVDVARHALASRGYDLEGVEVAIKVLPGAVTVVAGELVELPPRAVFTADASAAAVESARAAAGVRAPRPAAAANQPN